MSLQNVSVADMRKNVQLASDNQKRTHLYGSSDGSDWKGFASSNGGGRQRLRGLLRFLNSTYHRYCMVRRGSSTHLHTRVAYFKASGTLGWRTIDTSMPSEEFRPDEKEDLTMDEAELLYPEAAAKRAPNAEPAPNDPVLLPPL